jgi:hypothetical protein
MRTHAHGVSEDISSAMMPTETVTGETTAIGSSCSRHSCGPGYPAVPMIAPVSISATTRFAQRTARISGNQASGSVIGTSGKSWRTATAIDPCSTAMATLKTAFAGE